MPTVTPPQIDSAVLAFCRAVNPAAAPVYVPIRPAPGAPRSECFPNVRQKTEQCGGRLQYGWALWIWPKVYIEAEHHAVWVSAEGEMLDVTPPLQSAQRILFLPDESCTYDFESHRRRDNIRHALTNDRVVHNFLGVAAELFAFYEAHSNGRMVSMPPRELRPLILRQQSAYRALLHKYLTVNTPCTCGSGRKVKKCCGLTAARQCGAAPRRIDKR